MILNIIQGECFGEGQAYPMATNVAPKAIKKTPLQPTAYNFSPRNSAAIIATKTMLILSTGASVTRLQFA